MRYSFEIDWPLARRLAGRFQGRLPQANRVEAARLVADLKLKARLAGQQAAQVMGAPNPPNSKVKVVDRIGWASAASEIMANVLDELGDSRLPAGMIRTLARFSLGSLFGVGLGLFSRWLLGQFDAYTGSRTLYLLAPNLLAVERASAVVPEDFRLWVCAHEQTHALQFETAPWLVEYLRELLRGDSSKQNIDRVIATMTFLEGHADYVSDNCPIPSAASLRRRFARNGSGRAGLMNKSAQYRQGLSFCTEVTQLSGPEALRGAFTAPSHLPSRSEITCARAWLDRIYG